MELSDEQIRAKISSVKHWYHQIEIKPGIVTPGSHPSRETLKLFDFPMDCHGLRVLDLGTRDGFYAFELERRGAHVVAVDYMPGKDTGFDVAQKLLGSRVEYHQENIYNISPGRYGTFDMVLFLGLIYHLPDPMGALDIVRSVCTDLLYLETHAIDNGMLTPQGQSVPLASLSKILLEIPIMQFYPGSALNNDPTNYWGPNVKCMEMMLKESNFTVLSWQLNGARALFKCKVAEDQQLEYFRDIARGKTQPG